VKPSRERPATGHGEAGRSPGAQIHPDLVDRLLELYCDWRVECADVQASYERFLDTPPADRAAAFAAYFAALDREQSACDSYAEQVRLIQARCRSVWAPS
jgi:hypothetical protein